MIYIYIYIYRPLQGDVSLGFQTLGSVYAYIYIYIYMYLIIYLSTFKLNL
jgi:hypothetical protein